MLFVMLKAPNGARLLLNLEQVFAFSEDDAGLAAAISITGAVVPLGMRLDDVANDVLQEEEPAK